MSSEIAIKVEGLSKCYHIYDQPRDRLKQFVLPRFQKAAGLPVGKYYREHWAVRDVSFQVKKGETVGIIGRNGSGKSTLLKMICGTLNPTGGNVHTNGRVAALLELGSGFNPEFTGRENVYLNGAVLGLSNKEIDNRFEDIARFADIGEFIDQPIKTYSSGMLVRLAFAVIAHVDADILVVDEALAVGDVFFGSKCISFLKEFSKSGTVLFVSHDTNTVLNLCDRAALVKNGELVGYGSPREIVEIYHAGSLQEGKSFASQSTICMNADRKDNLDQINIQSGFRKHASSGGVGGGKILAVSFVSDGDVVRTVLANSEIEFHIWCDIESQIGLPIAGFTVKNRQGQVVFELNTASITVRPEASEPYKAHFVIKFFMPFLKTGEYLIDVALANGTLNEHTQLQWIYDCLSFNVLNENKSNGLVSISPTDILFELA